MQSLRLKKNEERRLRSGHLWIFSNEVDTGATPLKGFPPGELALVEDWKGHPMGTAYVNPDTLICARLLSRSPHLTVGAGFFEKRLQTAARLRERLFAEPFYRLAYGESDGLPGLVVDRFGDVFAVQTSTLGMERLQPLVIEALEKLFSPRCVVIKNTSGLRQLEGLENDTRIALGASPERVEIRENGGRFLVDMLGGQKTGWYFDHRANRATAARLAKGQRVLDLFAYAGAWGVQAALGGAAAVDCVDASEPALDLVRQNADLNGVSDRMRGVRADAFDFLKQAREERRHYDLIILDPPALIKRKKDVKSGIEAYQRLNQGALQLLAPGGFLVSASCSYHLQRETLHDILRAASRHGDRHLVFVDYGGQAADHPVHPAIPETEYLKAFFCAIGPSL
jgi:23S rRNA (cytosine1962-C5)-methyltransferase